MDGETEAHGLCDLTKWQGQWPSQVCAQESWGTCPPLWRRLCRVRGSQGRCGWTSSTQEDTQAGESGGSPEATRILAAAQLGFAPSVCESKQLCHVI